MFCGVSVWNTFIITNWWKVSDGLSSPFVWHMGGSGSAEGERQEA